MTKLKKYFLYLIWIMQRASKVDNLAARLLNHTLKVWAQNINEMFLMEQILYFSYY